MIEVELKCKLSPELLARLQEKLHEMHFEGTVHNVDVYYDTPQYNLLQQAVFLRVRNGQRVEFKFNEKKDREHGTSTERSFSLTPDADKAAIMNTLFARFLPDWTPTTHVQQAILTNGLVELARIDNRRDAYAGSNIYVSIDHVRELGDFLEVETRGEEGEDSNQAIARLQHFVSALNVQHIKVGYVELWLLAHNPRAYELGHYHL